jgi:hypothetical protein
MASRSELGCHPESGPETVPAVAVREELIEEQHVRGLREGAQPWEEVVDVATALEVCER